MNKWPRGDGEGQSLTKVRKAGSDAPLGGEFLNALECGDGQSIVVIGTEDGRSRGVRYRGNGFEDSVDVEFTSNAMILTLNDWRTGT